MNIRFRSYHDFYTHTRTVYDLPLKIPAAIVGCKGIWGTCATKGHGNYIDMVHLQQPSATTVLQTITSCGGAGLPRTR